MKTKQLIVCSAVTVVATGLTLLSSSTSQASDRGLSGMRMGGGHGGMRNGTIHQGIGNRAISGARGASNAIGRNSIENRRPTSGRSFKAVTQMKGRDDRGGHSEREHRGGNASVTRGEREPGDDHGHHHRRGDNKGSNASVTRGEREPGDDHGHHHRRGDDKGGNANVTRGEREPRDDHGHHREPGDR